MCLSVVDPTKLKTAEFVYLISEYAGKLLYTQKVLTFWLMATAKEMMRKMSITTLMS